MPGRPSFASLDTLTSASNLEFSNSVDSGLADLSFSHAVNTGLHALRSLVTPTPDQPIPLGDDQSQANPLPVQVTPHLQMQQFTPPEPMPSAADNGGFPDTSSGEPTPSGSAASSTPAGGVPPPAGAPSPAAMPSAGTGTGAFKDNNERIAYVRQSAAAHGHDPDIAARVALSEGAGPAGPVGDQGTSFGALQAHVGGGQGDDFQRQTGLDPRDLNNERALIDWQLSNLGQTGWSPFHGAARVGVGEREGIGTGRTGQPPAPAPVAAAQPAAMPQGQAPAASRGGVLDVNGIVNAYKDTNYTYGGPGGRTQGFGAPTDCSGFVASVYQNQYGLNLVPHTDGAYNQLRQSGAAEVTVKDAQPGDVVFYMGAGTGGAITHHMGIYAGDGKVLDDSVSGADGVHVRDVSHAGQYVILRDPRLNQQAPTSASVPPPIQPTGVAEASGGEKVTNRELQAQAQTGGPPWNSSTIAMSQRNDSSSSAANESPLPTSQDSSDLMLRQPLGMATSGPDTFPTFQDSQTEPASTPGTAVTGVSSNLPLASTTTGYSPPTDAPTPSVGASAAPAPGAYPTTTGAGAFQDDYTQSGRNPVPTPPTPAPMAQAIPNEDVTSYPPAPQPNGGLSIVDTSGPEQGPPAPAASPLKPVYDLAGNIQGYVHTGLQAAAPSLAAGIDTATSAGQAAIGAMNNGGIGSAILSTVDQQRAETDQQIKRQQEIWQQASDWETQNGTPDRTFGLRAVQDPAWRAANPDLAAEYDDVSGALAIAAGQSTQPGEVARAANAAVTAAEPVVSRVTGAVRSGIGDIRAASAGRDAGRSGADAGAAPAVGRPPRSTTTYGVFGVAPPEAGAAAADVARPRFVPPEVRMQTTPNMELPDDPRFAQAVEAHGGRITDQGAEVYVTRAQGPGAAGRTAARGGVFGEVVPEGGRSSYVSHNPTDNPNQVGGTQVLPPTKTLYRRPIVLDSEPGSSQGFNQAAEKLDIRQQVDTPRLDAARQAVDAAQNQVQQIGAAHTAVVQEIAAIEQGGRFTFPRSITGSLSGNVTPEIESVWRRMQAVDQQYVVASQALEQAQRQVSLLNGRGSASLNDAIERGVAEAQRAGPPGSPQRAQALKDLVSRYGGDPSTIDDLLAIRADTQAESQWAIKENIVAGNARKQGVDGVFTIKDDHQAAVNLLDQQIKAHPRYQEQQAIVDRLQEQIKQTPHGTEAWGNLRNDLEDAQTKQANIYSRLMDMLPPPPAAKISEVFDVQQGRNPTPGAPNPRIAENKQALDAAELRLGEVKRGLFGKFNPATGYVDAPTPAEAAALKAEYDRLPDEIARLKAERSVIQQEPQSSGQPGYSLHPDLVRPTTEAGSTTAAGTAGVVPIPMRTAGDVGASVAASKGFFDKATPILSQGLTSAVSGGVGAATAQQLGDPNDPNRALKGFAVGAVAPALIAHGASRLARRAGRAVPEAEGALATLGSAPGPRRFTDPANALAASHEAIGVPEPVSPRAGVPRIEAVRRFIVRQATDLKVDLAELQKDAQRTLGRPLTGDEMVTELSRRNAAGASKVVLDERVKPVLQGLDDERPVVTLPNGKPLTQRTALTQAMVLANNRDVSVALKAPDRAFSGGLTGADSEAALQHLIDSMAPEDQRAVASGMRDLNGVVETYRQKLVDAGVWTKDFADEMRSKYPNWIPTKILDYMADADKGAGVGTRSISMRDRGVRQYTLDGTVKSREDPIASLIRYVDESEARIQKNEVFNGFANMYDALKANPDSGWAQQVREVPNSATAASGLGERTVQGFQNGERRTFITSPSVSAAVRMEQGAQIPIMRDATSLFRELITRTPLFVAGQIPLDFMAGLVRTANLEGGPQHAPRVAAEIVKGYAEAFRGLLTNEFKGDAARYMQGGGAMAGFYERGINAAHHTVDNLTRKSMVEIKDAGDAANLAKWLATGGWVQAVGQRVELAPRIAAFRMGEQRALKAGADPATAALQGVMAGRNSTMDFQVGGTAAKVINQIVPFFNVGVQSSVTLARIARENPKAFPMTALGLVGAPAIAAEAWNRSDPQRAKDYADVPDYIKDRGIVVMLPGVTGTDAQGNPKPNYAMIPLRELAPVAIMSRELAANAMRAAGYEGQDEPRGWGALLGAAASASSPVQANNAADLFSSLNPVGVNTGLQLATNRDYFRNRDIATERNDQDASSLARGAAGAINAVTGSQVRPSQADFAIRDLTGGVGAAASAASDMLTGRTKDEQRIQSAPVVGGLVRRFVGDTTGGQLEKARDTRISNQARATASAVGLRDDQLTPVGNTIDNIPLMQSEQTSYQTRTNRYFDQELAKTRASAAWQQRPQERQQFVRDALVAAKERAAAEIMRNIPPNERQRRIGQAARQKAS